MKRQLRFKSERIPAFLYPTSRILRSTTVKHDRKAFRFAFSCPERMTSLNGSVREFGPRRHKDTKKNFVSWCLRGSLRSVSPEPHCQSIRWMIAPSPPLSSVPSVAISFPLPISGTGSRGRISGTEHMTSFERERPGIWTTKTQRHQEKLCVLVPSWFPSISLS